MVRSRVVSTRFSPSPGPICFTVSVTASAARAAPWRAAALATRLDSSAEAKGRAASCTSTTAASLAAERPFRTEADWRAPPGTARTGLESPKSSSLARASSPGGTTATRLSTSGQESRARAARLSTLSPPRTHHCLATPARWPVPPAAKMPVTRSPSIMPRSLFRRVAPRPKAAFLRSKAARQANAARTSGPRGGLPHASARLAPGATRRAFNS